MPSILAVLLTVLLQAGPAFDLADLQKFLGADFPAVKTLLLPFNEFLLRNVRPNSPQQAAQMEAQMALPQALGDKENIVALTLGNAGRGLVTMLFEEDFITERINLVFCPAAPRKVIALQVLFDDRHAIRDTLFLFDKVYKMPAPSPFETYRPAVKYGLAGVTYDGDGRWTRTPNAPPVTVFDLGKNAEAVYQPVSGDKLITGQLWVGDKNAPKTCPPQAAPPSKSN